MDLKVLGITGLGIEMLGTPAGSASHYHHRPLCQLHNPASNGSGLCISKLRYHFPIYLFICTTLGVSGDTERQREMQQIALAGHKAKSNSNS